MKHVCVLLSFLVVVSGCTRGLSHEQALRVIETSPLVKPGDDHVTVDGISLSSPTEAIVRATIAGQTTNLKFRRYDTGWTWEFLETKGGGWTSPDQGIGQIRESNRQLQIVQWAAKNEDAYRRSIETIDEYSELLGTTAATPRTEQDWRNVRKIIGEGALKLIEDTRQHPETYSPDAINPEVIETRRRHALAEISPTALDAWGSEILVHFDSDEPRVLFLSPGPDKQKGTDDDIICVAKGRQRVERYDGLVWGYDKSWVVPEGLNAAVSPHVTKTFGSVQYAKLLK